MQLRDKKADTLVNHWNDDAMSERFNTHKPIDEIHPDAAVNIYLGWPTLFEQIKYQSDHLGKKHLNILDLGCGTGEFAKNLQMHGHNLIGVDKSPAMLKIAKDNAGQHVKFMDYDDFFEGPTYATYKNKIDIVTAIHSLDWVEDMEEELSKLTNLLADKGLIIFAIFPKKHVIESLQIHDLFEDFDSETNPTQGVCNFDGIKVPVYVRDASFYDKYFDKIGFDKVLEFYPPFPQIFFKRYNWTGAKYPEMLILAYRKL